MVGGSSVWGAAGVRNPCPAAQQGRVSLLPLPLPTTMRTCTAPSPTSTVNRACLHVGTNADCHRTKCRQPPPPHTPRLKHSSVFSCLHVGAHPDLRPLQRRTPAGQNKRDTTHTTLCFIPFPPRALLAFMLAPTQIATAPNATSGVNASRAKNRDTMPGVRRSGWRCWCMISGWGRNRASMALLARKSGGWWVGGRAGSG